MRYQLAIEFTGERYIFLAAAFSVRGSLTPDLSDTVAKCRIGTAKFLHFYYFFITHQQKAKV